jgi:acetone carboxylase gamma subunit
MAECPHYHRRLIAKDDVLEFAECLDCGEILEVEAPAPPQPETETLSDA